MSIVPINRAQQPILPDDKPMNLDQDHDVQSGRALASQSESSTLTLPETNGEYPMHCDRNSHERMLADLKKWVG